MQHAGQGCGGGGLGRLVTLAARSELVCATLPRPLGVVFEEDTRAECARVAAIVPGTAADRQQGRARLDRTQRKSCVMEGDVLRAITCTTLVYPTDSLFGAKPARRTVTLFGADGQSWGKVAGALKRGLVEDGPVTVILERRLKEDGEPYYASEELVGGQGGQEAGMEEGGARVAAEPKSKDAGKERSAWDMLK